jgi:hypothetical protein
MNDLLFQPAPLLFMAMVLVFFVVMLGLSITDARHG